MRVRPVEPAVEGLQHPDIGVGLGTGGRGVGGPWKEVRGWLLGVEEVEHLQ